MEKLKIFLDALMNSTGINFELFFKGKKIFSSLNTNMSKQSEEYCKVSIFDNEGYILLNKNDLNCGELLKFTIENEYKKIFSQRESMLMKILNGEKISSQEFKNSGYYSINGSSLLVIYVQGLVDEALDMIRQMYSDEQIICIEYHRYIVVLGQLEEVKEHANSIREAITSNLYSKCLVSYEEELNDVNDIKPGYEKAFKCIMICKKFGVNHEVVYYNEYILENIVSNISLNTKQELLSKFKLKFDNFDREIIETIEEFINCNLNISDAAKNLYIHRNTLIYRLDKINRDTGFDIRKFKDASVFLLAFLIWKENKFNLVEE